MTEPEWVACTDPLIMLEFLRDKASDRKLRLFAVACCRRIWPQMVDERSRQAVEVSEQYADAKVWQVELVIAEWDALSVYRDIPKETRDYNEAHSAITSECDHIASGAAQAARASILMDEWEAAFAASDCA